MKMIRCPRLPVVTAALALTVVSLLVGLGAAAATEQLPALQQPDQPPAPPLPEGRRLPFPDLCEPTVKPAVELSSSVSLLRNEVGWVATGFKAGTQVQMTLISFLNEEVQHRQSLPVLPWCFTAGTFRMDIPDVHLVLVRGTGSDGEPAQVFGTITGIISTLPRETPTPRVTRPDAPTGFTTSQVNATTIRFDWVDNSNNETGFLITSKSGNINRPANTTTHNQGSFATDDLYCFSLFAVNDAGQTYGGTDCLLLRSGERGLTRPTLPNPPGGPR